MVAHLLRLRYRLLLNGFKRSTWALVSAVIGLAYGLLVLVGLIVGMIALSFSESELVWVVSVLGGGVAVLGWVIAPILLRGYDQSLSVAKLRVFPIAPQRLLVGLFVAGLLGVPGIVTVIAGLSTTIGWIGEPVALVAAPFAALLAVLTCVVASRAFESVGASLAAGRRYREIMSVAVFVPVLLLGPIIGLGLPALSNASADLPAIARIVSWSPLGAAWSIPGDLALGRPLEALAKTGIALATLALLVLAWRRSLTTLLATPPRSAAGGGRRKGLGPFSWYPATPTGAVAARTTVYWLRDPRYGGSLVTLPVLVVIAVFVSITGSDWFLAALGPVFAATFAITLCAEVAYDGTAFASHLSTGVSGAADRAGRVITLAIIAVPLVLVSTIVPLLVLDRAEQIPALLGIGFGLLLTGFGVSSIASARFLMPVPAAGESPFKTPPGSTFSAQLGMYAAWLIIFVLAIPELALGIAAIVTGSVVLGVIALVVGIALGTVLMIVGIRRGGALLERRGPELLASLTRARGA
ncbi:transporter [Labedella endophytica]|uniref:Transporter n=1 Tax=Labedella endophytica TaxID=1523160 RepID=A0A433JQW1_9MICO|nr:transporter [Labedella endophytica]RUQ98991.1 transporter [Labedella endophytica]